MGIWRSTLAQGIVKHGFRKWYERELMASHAHLVLTFLCLVGVLAAFELYERSAPWSAQATSGTAIVVCLGVGIWALRRFLYLLLHAETTANQAICPGCRTYARFELAGEPSRGDAAVLAVRCRKCSTDWEITS